MFLQANAAAHPATWPVAIQVAWTLIRWNSTDYKPNLPGAYHYEGIPIMPPDKTLVNPNGIKATTKDGPIGKQASHFAVIHERISPNHRCNHW